MNFKQKLFCKHYALCRNATQAAIAAGYSSRTAYSQGSRLLKNVEIRKCINAEIKELNDSIPTKLEIKMLWSELMRDKTQKASIRLNASNNLAKALFMFDSDISEWDNEYIKESEDKSL